MIKIEITLDHAICFCKNHNLRWETNSKGIILTCKICKAQISTGHKQPATITVLEGYSHNDPVDQVDHNDKQ